MSDRDFACHLRIAAQWRDEIRPLAQRAAADEAAREQLLMRIHPFVAAIDRFVLQLEADLESRIHDLQVVLGVAGLWYPNDWPEPEIKWALVPAARGRGLAAEAGRAVRQMAREQLPGVRLISLIAHGNEPSVRVAEAAGARLEREIEWRGSRAWIYRHPD